MNRSAALALLFAGLIAGFASQAQADPPTANRVFFNCTFTTDTVEGINLQDALNISSTDLDLLEGGQIEASYIIIYVRENPNDGQDLAESTAFTGPVLCTNASEEIVRTTEGAQIAGPVDIVGAEEASHLQIQASSATDPNPNPKRKRVCHTVASNTDCFTIQQPSLE